MWKCHKLCLAVLTAGDLGPQYAPHQVLLQRDSDPADYHRYQKENLRNKPNILYH